MSYHYFLLNAAYICSSLLQASHTLGITPSCKDVHCSTLDVIWFVSHSASSFSPQSWLWGKQLGLRWGSRTPSLGPSLSTTSPDSKWSTTAVPPREPDSAAQALRPISLAQRLVLLGPQRGPIQGAQTAAAAPPQSPGHKGIPWMSPVRPAAPQTARWMSQRALAKSYSTCWAWTQHTIKRWGLLRRRGPGVELTWTWIGPMIGRVSDRGGLCVSQWGDFLWSLPWLHRPRRSCRGWSWDAATRGKTSSSLSESPFGAREREDLLEL